MEKDNDRAGGVTTSAPPPDRPHPREAFYAHLDVCRQCSDHPFNLCPIGLPLLQLAAHPALKGKR